MIVVGAELHLNLLRHLGALLHILLSEHLALEVVGLMHLRRKLLPHLRWIDACGLFLSLHHIGGELLIHRWNCTHLQVIINCVTYLVQVREV